MRYEIHKQAYPSIRAEIWEIPEPTGHSRKIASCEDFRDAPRIVHALELADMEKEVSAANNIDEQLIDPKAALALFRGDTPLFGEKK